LRVATTAAAAVVVSGGTAVAGELSEGRDRSEAARTIGERIAGRHPDETRVVWSAVTDRPELALTFDDGPDPTLTPKVLDALERAGATGTFFMIGERVRAHPELVRAIVEAGHEVASHTWSHADLARAGVRHTTRELVDAAHAIEDIAATAVTLFRPPWGNVTGAAVRVAGELGHDVVLWRAGAEHLPHRFDDGAILLFHDGIARGHTLLPRSSSTLRAAREREVAGLPTVLARIAAADKMPVTVSALLS
jgi:peptidoglycan/xylan/chitin deacetylase (PgdA/CDA1 family)